MLYQWTETPVSMLLIAVFGNAQIEASLLMVSRLSYATPLLARRRLHDGAQHAPGRPRGPKQTAGGNPRTRARARPAGTHARVSLVRQNPVRVGRTAQPLRHVWPGAGRAGGDGSRERTDARPGSIRERDGAAAGACAGQLEGCGEGRGGAGLPGAGGAGAHEV